MREIISKSVNQTERIGEEFAETLKGNEVIALFGGLGMGKTAFTRGLVRGLKAKNEVSSPTFALINEYQGKFPIYHFDMYRIDSWDDLYSIGFFDYIGNGVSIIEWSENVEAALPKDAVRITISQGISENIRIFRFE